MKGSKMCIPNLCTVKNEHCYVLLAQEFHMHMKARVKFMSIDQYFMI